MLVLQNLVKKMKDLAEGMTDITHHSAALLMSSAGLIPGKRRKSNRRIPPEDLEGSHDIILSLKLTQFGEWGAGKCLQLGRMA